MNGEAFVVTLVAPSGYKQVFRIQGAHRFKVEHTNGRTFLEFSDSEYKKIRTVVVGQGFSHMLTYYDEGGNIAPIP